MKIQMLKVRREARKCSMANFINGLKGSSMKLTDLKYFPSNTIITSQD